MKTYAATNNAGKLAEMRAIFADSPLELTVYPEYASVPEVAADYLGNALLKAKALARQLADAGIRAAALADDSGMEVAALGGRPGVYSARYGVRKRLGEPAPCLLERTARGSSGTTRRPASFRRWC